MTNIGTGSGSGVARNSMLNLLGRILPSIVAVVTLPMIVRGLGAEGFGILSVAWIVLGYSNIFDLGLGRATIKFVAEYQAAEKKHLLPGLVWTSLALQLVQGIAGAIIIAAFVPYAVTHLFKMPPALIGETKATLLILCASLPILLVGNAIRGLLEAAQRFDLVNYVGVPASVAFYLLAPIAVSLHVRVFGIVLLQVLIRFLAALVYFVLSMKIFPSVRQNIALSKAALKPLASYGGWCTVSTIAGPTFGELERVMIASLVSVAALTYYSAPYELIMKMVIFPASIASALFPLFSYHGGKSGTIVSDLTSRTLKYLLLAMTPFTAVFVVFAREILTVWMGAGFAAQSTVVLQILAISFYLNVFAQIPYTSVQALGRPDLKAILDVVGLPTYALMAWWLLRHMGINGGALAKLFITIIDTSGLFIFAWKLNAFSIRDWGSGTFRRALGASFGITLAIVGLKFVNISLPYHFALLCACCLVYALIVWKVVVDDAERATIKDLPYRLFSGTRVAAASTTPA